jgi:hypothetical protein
MTREDRIAEDGRNGAIFWCIATSRVNQDPRNFSKRLIKEVEILPPNSFEPHTALFRFR